jgi:hypothetical protein
MSQPQQCPHLPVPDAQMSHRCLTELKGAAPADFYYTALQYGHYLWLQGHAGRAILAITRACYSNVAEADPILKEWPLPYAALQWIVANHHSDHFPGNPRISFQHQATRLRGERQELRRTRAWAVWAIIRATRPDLSGDAAQGIIEPSTEAIEAQLHLHGHKNEAVRWLQAIHSVRLPN